MPDAMTLLDMEEAAARTAIESAAVDASEIDLLITNRTVPDFLLGNPACSVHERLQLPKACLSMHTDVATHAFMLQLALAEGMVAAGRARNALIVQSCAPSRLMNAMDPIAPFFGDCATAAIVGRVPGSKGIASSVTYTDGRFPRTLIASVPGQNWYDDGPARLHVGDPLATQAVFMLTADVCKESVDEVLARAGRSASDVDFFCIHQGTPWLRRVVQEHAGLSHATSIDLFPRTAYLFASTIPATLAVAVEEGRLHDGDVVVLVGGGPGMTYGATLMVWGRS